MDCTAIWIIDENYVFPAYLSICSFVSSNTASVQVVYCSNFDVENIKHQFEAIHHSVKFEVYELPSKYMQFRDNPTIVNRLARMHYVQGPSDEIRLLIDADVIFSENS